MGIQGLTPGARQKSREAEGKERERDDTTIDETNGDHIIAEYYLNQMGSRAPPCGFPPVTSGPTLDANWLRAPGSHRSVLPGGGHMASALTG